MAETRPVGAALGELAFFRGLEPEALERLAGLARPVRWAADVAVFREGELGSDLYVVEEGLVALEIDVPGRGRTTVLTVGPGEMFGWSSFSQDRPKQAGARAVTETRAWALDAPGLRALCDADHEFGYRFTRRLLGDVSDRLKATRLQLLDLFRSPAAGPAAPGGPC